MLQNIREAFIGTTGKVVLGIILLLLAGTGLNYTITPRAYVAKVDGEEVPLRQVNETFRQLVARYGDQQLPPEFLDQLRVAAVNQVVTQTALVGHLSDAGFAVTDAQVAERIRDFEAFQTDGTFDPELYRRLLAQNSLSPAMFEADERQRLLVEQLRENLTTSEFITPSEFRRLIELSNEQREVEYALVPTSQFVDDVVIADADVASYYEANPTRFQTEASAVVDYVMVDPELARASIDVDEAALRAYFEDNSQSFTSEPQRRASHILLRTDEDPEAARELATTLLARIEAGEPFDELAKTYSKDAGSARQGGDLGWLTPGVYPAPAVDEAIFSLSPGGVSGIIESDFGLHIVRLDAVRDGGVPEFEAVADEIREQVVSARESARLLELEEQLADQLFESDTLEQIAAALGVEVETAESLSEGAPLPFGASDDIDEAVFGVDALAPGTLSDVIELDGDRTVILRVRERTPAGREPLEAVADVIRNELRQRAAAEVAAERGTQIAAALRADPDAELEALLADSGADYVAPKRIGRAGGDVPAALAAAVFSADVPDGGVHVGSVSAPGTGFIVYRVTDVIPGDPSEIPQEQIEAGRRQLALRLGASQMTAFTQGVLDETSVKLGDALETEVDGS